jgi:NAD(P) transhydrogenase subunit alpha
MNIAIPKETVSGERRVALTPDASRRLIDQGHTIHLESGAGETAYYPDSAYEEIGVTLHSKTSSLYKEADVIVKVSPPQEREIKDYPKGAVVISFLDILRQPELSKKLADRGLTALAMETIPRISRAQSMDALSSQASAAGYKAVLWAATTAKKFMPMLTTAAGTIPPAKAFVIGAGVAGLQAIATARRLGANVKAFDIRDAARGEVESLGAKFVDITLQEETEADGGYAKEVSSASQEQIHQGITDAVAEADIVITTAQVPGKQAPLLVTKAMVEAMKPGSVIIDMAADQGGNCELSKADETVEHNGVTILGPSNLPSDMAMHTSQMYARNIISLLRLLAPEKDLVLNFDDDIIDSACITHDGQVRNERVRELLNL